MTSLCGRTASPSQMEHPLSTPQILLPTIITPVEEHIFLTGILLLLWGELILIASFLHFLQHLDFARGKKISVMKIPHVTRITSQTEHSWLWNSPPTPNGAYPYRKLESILKWKKDGAKCYLWAMTLGSRWTHREDTHSVPNRVIRKRKHHCSQRRPSLEVQLRAQHYSPKPRSPQQEQSYTSEGASNYNFNSGA